MTAPIDISGYSSVFAIDSQVALEMRPLAALPWRELDPGGSILLLALPRMLNEVDSKKRDGRLATRAREFNRLIRPAVDTSQPTRICQGLPSVDLVVCPVRRIDWNAFEDLDPDQGDDRIAAEALHALVSDPTRVRVLSHDTRPRAAAIRHGMSALPVPDHWLLPPEPGPAEKEVQRLKQRVSVLESKEPSLSTKIEFTAASPMEIPRVRPLSADEQQQLIQSILKNNPHKSARDAFGRDHSYEGKYTKFKSSLPRFAAAYHSKLELLYVQTPFKITICNSGNVTAKDLVVEMNAQSGGLYTKLVWPLVFGPRAPEPEPFPRPYFPDIPTFDRYDSYDVVFSPDPIRGPSLRVQCADFRHGREWTFSGVASLDPNAPSPFRLSVRMTASNLSGEVSQSAELPFSVTDRVFIDLIDFENRRHLLPFPMNDVVDRAIETRSLDGVQFQSDEDDD